MATISAYGAAIGRAFLETLMERNSITVATTHDPNIKALALVDKRIMNASMEFDETSRTPTYRIALGIPGRSRALETAERLGLPNEVLGRARQYLTQEHRQFEDLLARLESDARETTMARKEAVRLKEEAERMKKEWTERTQSSVNEMLEKTRQKLRRIIETAQDEARSSVRKIDEARKSKEMESARAHLVQIMSESGSRIENALEEEAPELAQHVHVQKTAPTPSDEHSDKRRLIQEGATVRLPKWKNTATVLSIQGEKVKVAMGALQLTVGWSDIEPATGAAKPKQRAVTTSEVPVPESRIDIRGQRYDEAMAELERYLDQAFRSGGLKEVVIVHGLGSGALREGTRALLAKLPYVKDYRDGGAGQGGTGATLVEFDV